MGKCPHCENLIGSVIIDTVDGHADLTKWRTLLYKCPTCQKVLSCQIDPIAIRTDIVQQVVKEIKGR